MLNFLPRATRIFRTVHALDLPTDWQVPEDIIWIELVSPERQEEAILESALGLDLPTSREMAQIEPSSRLYMEGGATFMTASLLSRYEEEHPILTPVTFVLAGGRLITLRYEPLRAFSAFSQRLTGADYDCTSEVDLFLDLLDAVIERLADVLERGSERVQSASNAIFDRPRGAAFEPLLTSLARTQSLAALARTSLAGLARLASFAALAPEIAGNPSAQAHLISVQQDVQSLTEHAAAQSAHIAFLLDAALGLINIEQNVSIKTFSVFTVLLMPPTLIGAIYGMNFEVMPELTWPWGYPLALGLMVVSGVAPLLWFRHKGWF
ncbi:MAG: magnesium transporter CorA family protein [Phenylobacterium sp.]|jgi:magnesium transporter|uniref:magnesium transporter CorA family protein n=1 Tax=Phenylobacterium sp. TaxID=1871053 RepID=UPI0030164F40